MTTEVVLNGTKYRLLGEGWVDAKTYTKPPQVIIQELNRRLPVRLQPQAAVRTVKPKPSYLGRTGQEFTALQDQDFQKRTLGTNWRRRQSLGGLLAQQLSDKAGHGFLSWSLSRSACVHVAMPEYYDPDNGLPYAKFEFRLDESKALYGLYIEKSNKPMDSTWDWKRCLSVLGQNSQLVRTVEKAIDRFGLYWMAAVWDVSNHSTRERTITITGYNPMVWQEDGQQDTITWPVFLERLHDIRPEHWCDLRLCQTMNKTEAIAAGVRLADPVVDVYRALLPLYLASIRSQSG
jgi:hypothetical protein